VRRTHSFGVEMAVLAVAFVVWQLLRIPFEGSRAESLKHARDWLAAERALHVDIEAAVIRTVHEHGSLDRLAELAYGALHVPVVVGLLAAVCVRYPLRYPKLRTTFVLAHVPALVVLAAYPLAPPHWLASMPFAGGPPSDLADLRNATAAAVSLHFGYTVFVAGTALWLWPRSPLAWACLLYPPFIFAVILGTGNHYVLDTVIGAACIALAAAAAQLIHGRAPRDEPPAASAGRAVLVGLAAALIGFLAEGIATGGFRPGLA
jgi:PAP2 superfamily